MHMRWGFLAVTLLVATVLPAEASGPLQNDLPRRIAGLEALAQASETHLTLAVSGLPGTLGIVTAAATLTLPDGTPVSGAVIDFTMGSRSPGVGITDSSGRATHTWTVPPQAGSYALSAAYAGDSTSHLSGSQAGTDLVLDRAPQ